MKGDDNMKRTDPIQIISDGTSTKIYVNGEKIDQTTMIDFQLIAQPGETKITYKKYATDEDGNILYNGENQEKHVVTIEDGIAIDMLE